MLIAARIFGACFRGASPSVPLLSQSVESGVRLFKMCAADDDVDAWYRDPKLPELDADRKKSTMPTKWWQDACDGFHSTSGRPEPIVKEKKNN
eukprot:SAG11_NODE_8665_length_989_cov_1.551685_1_plen_92_part_10